MDTKKTGTLDWAAREYRWDATHDYTSDERKDGKIVALYGLGLWERDLEQVRRWIPTLQVTELRRVEHEEDAWLRVDIKEGS